MTASRLKISGSRADGGPPGRLLQTVSRTRWLPPLAFVAAGLALFGAYLRQARTLTVESDGASIALQAWDMLHGNVLLRGWSLSDVSFYTTELPQYAVVEFVHGLNGEVVPIAAAITYTLVVILAALLAKGSAAGREGAIRALIAAGIMLAPTLGMGSRALLSSPDHTGTQVPLLLTWLILDRAGRRRWVPVAVAVLLAWAQVADSLVLYEGTVPLVMVCVVRAYRGRSQPREHWYELSLAAGAIASAGAAMLAVRLIRQAGGFTVLAPRTIFSDIDSLSAHLWVTVRSVLLLFGADFSGQKLGTPHAAVSLVHLAGVILAGWAFARAVRRFWSQDLVVQVLAVSAAVLLFAYTTVGTPTVAGGAHEIVGVLPIGAVLAGRVLTGQLIRDGMIPALAVVLACYTVILAHNVVQPPVVSDGQRVASWLEARHLTYGLADYWTANAVTLDSDNRVQVRPVNKQEAERSWYTPALHDARFFLIPTACAYPVQARDQWQASVQAAYGAPAATYSDAGFLILVWHKNLLAGHQVPKPPRPPCSAATATPAGPGS